ARVNLAGERAIRFTVQPGNMDFDYLAFIPAVDLPTEIPLLDPPTNGSAPISGEHLAGYSSPVGQGLLLREVYKGIDGSLLKNLQESPKLPNSPDEVSLLTQFEAPANVLDQYGQRLSGYLTPPTTGEYTFYLASDDQGALFLSTDEDPTHKVQIASEPIWNY